MKIIHFISGINNGGVEQFLINYTDLLNKNFDYHQIIVFQHMPDKICLKKLENAGNKCIEIADKRKKPIRNFYDTFSIIKKERPDIIHCHMSLLNFVPLFVGMICGIKIRISHSHISRDNINNRQLSMFFKKLNIGFSTNLVACGEDAGRYMYGKRKFKIIRNAIDISDFLPLKKVKASMRLELGIPENGIVIGNIGRFVRQKNHKRLIDIFETYHKKNDNSYLVLIGSGKLEPNIRNYVKELNLNDYVKFIGNVADTSKYYQIMDLFLLPSLYEGLPIVAIEAQCAGIPVLMSDSIDEDTKILNTTLSIGLNESNDVWLTNIEKLLSMRKNSVEMIKRQFVIRGFSIDKSFLSLNNYYKTLIKE